MPYDCLFNNFEVSYRFKAEYKVWYIEVLDAWFLVLLKFCKFTPFKHPKSEFFYESDSFVKVNFFSLAVDPIYFHLPLECSMVKG